MQFNSAKVLFYALYTAGLICVLLPFLVISQNTTEFTFNYEKTFFASILLSSATVAAIVFFGALAIAIAIYLLGRLLRTAGRLTVVNNIYRRSSPLIPLAERIGARIPRVSHRLERVVFWFLMMLTLLALYVPWSVGILDGLRDLRAVNSNIAIAFFGGIIGAVLLKHRLSIMLVVLAGPIVVIAIGANKAPTIETAQQTPIPLSTTAHNILFLSFDSLQTEFVQAAFEQAPELQDAFADFTLYEDVLAVGPDTFFSTKMTLLGELPEAGDSFFDERVAKPKHAITHTMQELGYATENRSEYFHDGHPATHSFRPQYTLKDALFQSPDYYTALRAGLLRVGPRNSGIDRIGIRLHSWHARVHGDALALIIAEDANSLVRLKRRHILFDKFIEKVDVGNASPTIRFHHYLFTHAPMRLTEDCTQQGRNHPDVSPTTEAVCALGKMANLLDKLKQMGAYTNSTIFFASDHGFDCWGSSRDSNDIRNVKLDRQYCYSRYTPFLLAKQAHATGELATSTRPISLFDIARTVCTEAADEADTACARYEGYDIFAEQPAPDTAFRPIMVLRPGEGKPEFADFNFVQLPRNTSLRQYMLDQGLYKAHQ